MCECRSVSDAGAAFLRVLAASLRELDLRVCSGVSEAGVAHIGCLTALSRLCLAQCDVYDAAGKQILPLAPLRVIDLCQMTGDSH